MKGRCVHSVFGKLERRRIMSQLKKSIIKSSSHKSTCGIEIGAIRDDEWEYLFRGKFDIDELRKGNEYLTFDIYRRFLTQKDYMKVTNLLEEAGLIISKSINDNRVLILDMYDLSEHIEKSDKIGGKRSEDNVLKTINSIVNKQMSIERTVNSNNKNRELFSAINRLESSNRKLKMAMIACVIGVVVVGFMI
jgi:hypothetical protein